MSTPIARLFGAFRRDDKNTWYRYTCECTFQTRWYLVQANAEDELARHHGFECPLNERNKK